MPRQVEAKRRGEDVPQPRGVQHNISAAKNLRREAAALDIDIAEENRKYQSRRSTMTWPKWSEFLRRREAVVAAVVAVVVVEQVRA